MKKSPESLLKFLNSIEALNLEETPQIMELILRNYNLTELEQTLPKNLLEEYQREKVKLLTKFLLILSKQPAERLGYIHKVNPKVAEEFQRNSRGTALGCYINTQCDEPYPSR